jgi:concanavalin A-like lectin/glucanase superfamily protein
MKKLLLSFILVLFLQISCQKQTFTPTNQTELGELSFAMSMVNAPEDVVDINGFLTRDSHDTIFFTFNILNESATATVENISPRIWNLTVNAFDINTVVIYTGSTDVNVSPGVVTQVNLQLNPTTGSLEIIVTWGPPNVQDSSMILYLPFNGNANDASGYENNGVVYGAQLTDDRNGNPNSAYLFDGYNDYIEIEHSAVLQPSLPITISMWIKYSNPVFGSPLNSNYHATNYYGTIIGLNLYDNRISIAYGDGGLIGPSSRRSKLTTRPIPDTWFHFVGIIRDSTDMDIYINGINVGGTYDGSGGEIAYDNGNMNIGRLDTSQNGPPRYLNGELDEIIMFNRALTEQEVLTLYQNNM